MKRSLIATTVLYFQATTHLGPNVAAFAPSPCSMRVFKNRKAFQSSTPFRSSVERSTSVDNRTIVDGDAAILDAFREVTPDFVLPKVTNERRISSEGIVTILGISDFLDFVNSDKDQGSEGKQICVIKYHAHWCKVCHRVGIKYKKLALDFSKENHEYMGKARFANVEISANMELCQKLGIKKFPFVEMYEGGTKIAAFGTGPAYKFSLVRDTLLEKLTMSVEEKGAFVEQFKENIDEGRKLIKELEEEV
jgi:hypothetical protein